MTALGSRPLIFPAIAIVPPANRSALERAQRELDRYDYAVFVSANAVEYGVAEAAKWSPRLLAFAPGPSTAAALMAIGIANVRVPTTTFDSEGLLKLPEFADAKGKRVVIFRGGVGRELLGDTLVARGATVDYVDCYRRAKPDGDVAGLLQAWRERRIDAVTLTSSEGFDNLWSILDKEGRSYFARTPTFVTHARIAERARAVGLGQLIITPPADAGLIASLLAYFATHSLHT